MIILGEDKRTVIIDDNKTGQEVAFEYRDPTTDEEIQYSNSQVKRRGANTTLEIAETRLKFGSKILTGIREGDFGQKKEGKVIPLSSDPLSPNFNPAWKKLVKDNARHLIMLLAIHVFEAPGRIVGNEVKDEDEDEETDV